MKKSLIQDIFLEDRIKLSLIIVLIFSIIFKDNIELFKSKSMYYFIFIVFVLNVILLKNNPGIILLVACLFIYVWYDHNMVNNE